MPYKLGWTDRAFDRLRNVPEPVLNALDAALARLAADPVKLSRPAVFPYPAQGQVYHFQCDHEGIRYWFVVFFRFHQDEEQLVVFDVTVTPH